jgi:hypothetical protein
VIFAHTHTQTWPHFRATLTHDDVSRNDDFATVLFYAKATTS